MPSFLEKFFNRTDEKGKEKDIIVSNKKPEVLVKDSDVIKAEKTLAKAEKEAAQLYELKHDENVSDI